MMKTLVLISLACCCTFGCLAQGKTKTDHIKQLLETTGAGKMGVQMANQMMSSFSEMYTGVPDTIWAEFKKEINEWDLLNLIIPVYDKYYTDDEIMQLIKFYNTDLGKKMIERTPLIAQESYKAGETWGRKIGENIANRLMEKGYAPKNNN